MDIDISVDMNLGLDDKIKKLGGNAFGNFVSQEVHKQYTPWMPANTKAYSTQINFQPWQYTHLVPYAEEVYTTHKNYRTDINPYATANYIEVGESVAMPKIMNSIENYINKIILK